MKGYKPHLSSIGDVPANAIAVACYVCLLLFWSFAVVPLLLLFFLEKKSGLVRFHAIQVLLLWLVRGLAGGDLPFVGLAAVLTADAAYMQAPLGWAGDMASIAIRLGVALLLMLLAVAGVYHSTRWHAWRVPLLGWLAVLVCAGRSKAVYTGGDAVPEGCRVPFSKRHSRYAERAEDMALAAGWAGGRYEDAGSDDEAVWAETVRPDESAPSEEKPDAGEQTVKWRRLPGTKKLLDMREGERRSRREGKGVRAPADEYSTDAPDAGLPPEMRDPPMPADML